MNYEILKDYLLILLTIYGFFMTFAFIATKYPHLIFEDTEREIEE